MQTEPRNKTSQEIQNDIETYLKGGGKIKVCPPKEPGIARTKEELERLVGKKSLAEMKAALKFYEERNLTLAQKQKRGLI